jgi:uncharacterized protein YndB with AHSA1/START domain
MGSQIGAPHVRRSGLIQATAERVWEEFTSFERFSAWVGRGHRRDVDGPGLGGRILLRVEVEGTRRSFGGPIRILDPAREPTLSNSWETDGWPAPTLIAPRLTSLFDACHVELFHTGFERLAWDASTELQG